MVMTLDGGSMRDHMKKQREESTKVKDDDIDSDMPPHDLTKLEQLSEVISYCCNVL